MVFQFKPTAETHNLKGKVVIVTGGSSGVGREASLVLARLGATLIIVGRNKEKTCAVIDNIKESSGNQEIEFLQVDFADLDSVRQGAKSLKSRKLCIDVLMNNAGIAALPGMSKDGFEIQFATNHLGPFLFTELLIPLMNRKSPSRIVFVSSRAAGGGKKYNFNKDVKEEDTSIVKLQPYSNSKLANALYAKKLSQVLKDSGVTTYSLHPGVVATDIWKTVPWPFQFLIKQFMLSEAEGAYTQLFCAIDPSIAGESGLFYDDCKSRAVNPIMDDQDYIDQLYAESKEFVKAFL